MAAIRKVQKRAYAHSINLPVEIVRALDIHLGDHMIFVLGENGWVGMSKVDLLKHPALQALTEAGIPAKQYDKLV